MQTEPNVALVVRLEALIQFLVNATSIFFLNVTATTELYTLSLHDALPISAHRHPDPKVGPHRAAGVRWRRRPTGRACDPRPPKDLPHSYRSGPARTGARAASGREKRILRQAP